MVFSENLFLFGFLPVALWGYLLAPSRLKNLWLLIVSLAFYAYGERIYLLLMVFTILVNYGLGRVLGGMQQGCKASRQVLALSIVLNLAVLGWFKYANFLADSLSPVLTTFGLPPLELAPIHLPIGISFFTFQAMSYVIDVYRTPGLVQRSPAKLALYISMFPQLIAGPIVRYAPIAASLDVRKYLASNVVSGGLIFAIGLSKKVILADTFAVHADSIFSLPASDLTMDVAWLGALCYALQIYFDFSGYSDMAVGLGRILGFEFPKNFNYPYISSSVTEFWRRWHISLSSWFRDYLYIPLGGNRHGAMRTYINLWVVFLLCGLWHGAAWTFVLWGLWHGLLLVIERAYLGRVLSGRAWLGLPYTWLVVLVGWVLFRADNLDQAKLMFMGMVGMATSGNQWGHLGYYLDSWHLVMLVVGLICATPLTRQLLMRARDAVCYSTTQQIVWKVVMCWSLLISSMIVISSGSYSPFIYFRF